MLPQNRNEPYLGWTGRATMIIFNLSLRLEIIFFSAFGFGFKGFGFKDFGFKDFGFFVAIVAVAVVADEAEKNDYFFC